MSRSLMLTQEQTIMYEARAEKEQRRDHRFSAKGQRGEDQVIFMFSIAPCSKSTSTTTSDFNWDWQARI